MSVEERTKELCMCVFDVFRHGFMMCAYACVSECVYECESVYLCVCVNTHYIVSYYYVIYIYHTETYSAS